MKRYGSTIFMIIFLTILLIPSVGMLVFGPSESENGEELVMPVIYSEEGGFNRNYLQELSDIFEQRFAFRKQLVTAYSFISENVFGTSAQSGVIVGNDGWLFFNDTLADYQRTNLLNGRQIHNAVRHLELINEYCEGNGIEFIFVIAPNKNTLYPGYMPYYLIQGEGQTNRQMLFDLLSDTDINYIDFGSYDTFIDSDTVYYFHRDSHWNNMGAAIVSNAILTLGNIEHHNYVYDEYTFIEDHNGDLDQMIHPSSVVPEADVYFNNMPEFTYVNEIESNFDPRIYTTAGGTGSLLMYRDSFGSSLLPFMAEPFASAFFSRSNSCQINDFISNNPDILVFEKAERFISQLCGSPSRLPAPVRELPADAVAVEISDFSLAEAGDYITVTGTLPEGSWEDDSIIYIVSADMCFEAYPVSDIAAGTEGFQALLEKNSVSTDNIMVFIA